MRKKIKKVEDLKEGDIINCGFYQPAEIIEIRELKNSRKMTLWLYGKNKKEIIYPSRDRKRLFLLESS